MSDTSPKAAHSVALVVDVDGTLIKTDLLHETTLQFAARHPLQLWKLGLWLLGGKAQLKDRLADHVETGDGNIPLRDETLGLIRSAQDEGRPVYLASASHARWVEPIAKRVGGIAGIMCSDGAVNLAGASKAKALCERFGSGNFDYAGDARVDFPVWAQARRKLLVASSAGLENAVLRQFADAEIIARPRASMLSYLRAMRPHQWVKNLLLFLPILAGHQVLKAGPLVATLAAFLAFCLAASSAYLINDLLDLPGDREHPRKSRRPFAAGDMSIPAGIALSILLMAVSFVLSAMLAPRFVLMLAAYVLLTLAYSMHLKRRLIIDVIVLAGLYTLRVMGGVEAVAAEYSPWLLMFSLFLFLCLATTKRCSELVALREAGQAATPGRGYQTGDLAVLFPLSAAAGYSAVMVVALYLTSDAVIPLYHNPKILWLICPLLLLWISRLLVISNRGHMHDDPLVFAFRDRVSWMCGLISVAIIMMAI